MKKTLNFVAWMLISILLISGLAPLTSCEPDDDGNETCDTCVVARKPNIYLYPTETIDLDVFISFPQGGEVIVSEPEYNTGWSVSIEPNGLIDNQYGYLFYESSQADVWQREKGWIVEQSELKPFFESNLSAYGFNENEIKDFTDYWIPILTDSEKYKICPQTTEIVESVIELIFSEQPDNVQRLFYTIEKADESDYNIITPEIDDDFVREGFHVLEWGVVLYE